MDDKKGRLAVWRHPDGRNSAIDVLSKVISKHAETVAINDISLTTASNFAEWVPKEELTSCKSLLLDLFQVDARGACFRQSDLASAVEKGMKDAGKYLILMERTRGALCTAEEICGLVAYKIRILAKAMRSRASNFEFQEFQHIMATSSSSCATSSSERRTQRLQQRANPLVNFRGEDEEGRHG